MVNHSELNLECDIDTLATPNIDDPHPLAHCQIASPSRRGEQHFVFYNSGTP